MAIVTETAAPPGGYRIGRYRLLEELASDRVYATYRAADAATGREVRLDVVPEERFDSPVRVTMFLAEGSAAARIKHEHLVPVVEAGHAGPLCFIASEYRTGRKLSESVERLAGGYSHIATIVRELALALQAVHDQPLVHRDVRTSNVFLDGDRPCLGGLGLSTVAFLEEASMRSGEAEVSPYLAPEQAAGKFEHVGPACDQYALGVILYELLTGQLPFGGVNMVLLSKILREAPPAPRSLRANVPRALEAICQKTLAKAPADRYGSCLDLATDLGRWLDDKPVLAGGGRSRMLVPGLVAAGGAAVVLAGAGWWFLGGASSDGSGTPNRVVNATPPVIAAPTGPADEPPADALAALTSPSDSVPAEVPAARDDVAMGPASQANEQLPDSPIEVAAVPSPMTSPETAPSAVEPSPVEPAPTAAPVPEAPKATAIADAQADLGDYFEAADTPHERLAAALAKAPLAMSDFATLKERAGFVDAMRAALDAGVPEKGAADLAAARQSLRQYAGSATPFPIYIEAVTLQKAGRSGEAMEQLEALCRQPDLVAPAWKGRILLQIARRDAAGLDASFGGLLERLGAKAESPAPAAVHLAGWLGQLAGFVERKDGSDKLDQSLRAHLTAAESSLAPELREEFTRNKGLLLAEWTRQREDAADADQEAAEDREAKNRAEIARLGKEQKAAAAQLERVQQVDSAVREKFEAEYGELEKQLLEYQTEYAGMDAVRQPLVRRVQELRLKVRPATDLRDLHLAQTGEFVQLPPDIRDLQDQLRQAESQLAAQNARMDAVAGLGLKTVAQINALRLQYQKQTGATLKQSEALAKWQKVTSKKVDRLAGAKPPAKGQATQSAEALSTYLRFDPAQERATLLAELNALTLP